MRFFLSGLFISSLFVTPWYIAALIGAILVFTLENFWEIIPAAFVVDTLYGIPLTRFHNFRLTMTFFAVLLFVLSFIIKKKMWPKND